MISQVDIVDTGGNGSARGLYFEPPEDMGVKERKKVDSCRVEKDIKFETLEPYFRFIAHKSNKYGPKFEMQLLFDFDEFYSIGFDTKEQLQSLLDALTY